MKFKFVFLLLVCVSMLLLTWCGKKWKCINVTSYDYNRGNDMKCTKLDGETFYTSYEGAKVFEEKWTVPVKKKCIDVTSYDRNRNNDMKCTRSDWSIFYTSYEGANRFEANR